MALSRASNNIRATMRKRTMNRAILAALALMCATSLAPAQAPRVSDGDVVEAYEYMLARWLVLRREALDFKAVFKWNEVFHRAPGGLASAEPNLNVAGSEAWIAVDDTSCT